MGIPRRPLRATQCPEPAAGGAVALQGSLELTSGDLAVPETATNPATSASRRYNGNATDFDPAIMMLADRTRQSFVPRVG